MNIEVYLQKWNLSEPRKIASTRTSEVYLVDFRGQSAVLKALTEIGKRDEASGEIALRCFNGNGSVRLLESDHGAHLLSYADGKSLKELVAKGRDAEATEVVCQVIKKLHFQPQVPTESLKSIEDVFQSLFQRASLNQSDPVFARAANCASGLLGIKSDQVVLHGDLHHTNIIYSSDSGWVSIDPKGLIGERCYEFANIFYNPDDMPEVVEHPSRIQTLSRSFSDAFEIDSKRILRFAFVFGCLSASWAIDDGLNPARRLRIAKMIEALLKS